MSKQPRQAHQADLYEQNKPRLRQIGIQEGEAQSFLQSVGYRVQPMTDMDIVDWMAVPA
jgi:hypothetical protein